MTQLFIPGVELVVGLTIVFWIIGMFGQRNFRSSQRLRVGRLMGRLAGSRNDKVDPDAFAYQLGFGTVPIWYTLLELIKAPYTLAASLFVGVIIGRILHSIFQWKAERDNE
jgi:hypothetical protein